MSTMRRLVPFEELTKDDLKKIVDWMEGTIHDMNFEEAYIHADQGNEHWLGKLRGFVNHVWALAGKKKPFYDPAEYTDVEVDDEDLASEEE
jgi:hypothetical protein